MSPALATERRRLISDNLVARRSLANATVNFETGKAKRLYPSLLEHQAQMLVSGEAARQLAERRRRFWRSTFFVFVGSPAILSALMTGMLMYFGAGLEQIASVGGVGALATLVGFLILYPHG